MRRAAGVALVMAITLVACGEGREQDVSSSEDETLSSALESPRTAEAANQPLRVMVEVSPKRAVVGEEVTFRVTATDPDAVVGPPGNCGTYHWFGDEEARPAGCSPMCAALDHYEEVPPEPGELTETFTHVYSTLGTFEATFRYSSHRPCHVGFRFGNEGEATATVSVLPLN